MFPPPVIGLLSENTNNVASKFKKNNPALAVHDLEAISVVWEVKKPEGRRENAMKLHRQSPWW